MSVIEFEKDHISDGEMGYTRELLHDVITVCSDGEYDGAHTQPRKKIPSNAYVRLSVKRQRPKCCLSYRTNGIIFLITFTLFIIGIVLMRKKRL